mmetsp:Transcript_63468/g.143156  ORF Transcript_63468/g.143156 Transcript_63468/m.143156 type:complete len:245 (+) Transcript_63468:100-834(+)
MKFLGSLCFLISRSRLIISRSTSTSLGSRTKDLSAYGTEDERGQATSVAEELNYAFFDLVNEDGAQAFQAFDSKLGFTDSHELVDLDERGAPINERFTYVNEHDCIGCTLCAGIAQATFFMEKEHGRARVYQQHGDTDSMITEAMDTCPVSCIYNVDFEELTRLEVGRRGQVINNVARLVSQAEGRGVSGLSRAYVGGVVRNTKPIRASGLSPEQNSEMQEREAKKRADRAKKAQGQEKRQADL